MKKIQRIADNQYLVDASKDVWTESVEEAKVFRSGELIIAKAKLFIKGVKPEDIEEVDVVTTTTVA